MAYVSQTAQYHLARQLLSRSSCFDAVVNHWEKDQVYSCLEDLSRKIFLVPSSKALQKKQEQQIFHDDLPASVVGTGAKSLILKTDRCEEMERYFPFCHKTLATDAQDSANKLAKADIFYIKSANTFKCFACYGMLNSNHGGTTMGEQHTGLYPKCKFIIIGTDQWHVSCCGHVDGAQKGFEGNSGLLVASLIISDHWTKHVLLSAAERDQAVKHFPPSISCESQLLQISLIVSVFQRIGDGSFVYGHTIHHLQQVASPEPNGLAVRYTKYPDKVYKQARLEIFYCWSQDHNQIPAYSTRVGFYATGLTSTGKKNPTRLSFTDKDDEVNCFCCECGLKDWDEGDDPWKEHGDLSDQSSAGKPPPPTEYVPHSNGGAHNLLCAGATEPAAEPTEVVWRKNTGTEKKQPKEQEDKKKQTENSDLSAERKYQRETGQQPHKLFSLAVILSTIPSTFSSGAVCPENQTAELGQPGYIHCNFSEGFNSVYWFDDTSDGSNAAVAFNGDKSGSGYETGIYDIDLNGSLTISNVTIWHERQYTCIVYQGVTSGSYKVALQVIASPARNQLPTIQCQECHQEYFNRVMNRETITCSFGSARPPVQVEWLEQRGDGYQHVEMQQSNWTENSNGTFRSTTTLHSLQDKSNLIHSLICIATWPLSDWWKQRGILLDFSSSISFSDVRPKVQYMEISKHYQIHCGDLASSYVVWKRILSNNEPEVIGFHSHVKTETVSGIDNVEVSTEGSLIFSSPQVRHEGIYACINGDGEKEEIEMTNLKLLIPPSPPYIQITGCNDASTSCVFREEVSKELTCAVYGARPNVTLKWVAEDEHKISFFNYKEVHKERGTTSDTVLTVQYSVSQDILCGEEIVIKCHLYGPLANIMKAESTAMAIIPATCMEHRGNSGQIWSYFGLILVLVLIFVIIILVVIVCIICFKKPDVNSLCSPTTCGTTLSPLLFWRTAPADNADHSIPNTHGDASYQMKESCV